MSADADVVVAAKPTQRPRRGRPQGSGTTPPLAKKNVSVDGDTLLLLQTVQEQMEQELGFRPTLAQTVQRLVVEYARRGTR